MKYMLLIYGNEDCWTEDERKECMLESMKISNELQQQGKLISSDPLYSITTATSVRVREGNRQITDGPFAETSEQLGGYYLIDVENLDEAIAIASRLPPAKLGTVEIRPIFPKPELPESSTEMASDRKASV
ncbi:YciI family protein [Aporhodopirellula aestuarii]|uniref:YciI family protein n=1 Tax=Aporhodopirellula aestuarii TaxID=2950107 RepID=A0ABT0TXJ3_9BACT|nr:YciI family protein [Aporhodopirellula aestuarii]MCM2369099.1 YciI family protein [Aporhodopirellula aestuarii]